MSKYSSSGRRVMENGDKDYRYTIRIYLLREDRPKYWEFHCPYCGTKVCELNGPMVYGIDVTPDTGKLVARKACRGRDCRFWYEFVLSS